MNIKQSVEKSAIKALALIGALCFTASTASAYDFVADSIYYDRLAGNTCAVTYGTTAYSGVVTIPAQVTSEGVTYSVVAIGAKAFQGCTGLTGVTVPESVTSIGDYALSGCTSLPQIEIPSKVTYVGICAF